MTGLLCASEGLHIHFLASYLTVYSEQLGGPLMVRGDCTAPWMVPGETNYSAMDSPGEPLLGGTTYNMTGPQAATKASILADQMLLLT